MRRASGLRGRPGWLRLLRRLRTPRPERERELPGEEAEAPDPTVLAKLDASAPIPAVQSAEVDHQNTTGVAVDSSRRRLPRQRLEHRRLQLRRPPDPALWHGTAQLRPAVSRWTRSSNRGVRRRTSSETRSRSSSPKKKSAPPAIDGLSAQNLSPHSAELRAQIDPSGARNRIPLPVRHRRLRAEPVAPAPQSRCRPASSPPASATSEVSVEVSGLAARHRLLLPPSGNATPTAR